MSSGRIFTFCPMSQYRPQSARGRQLSRVRRTSRRALIVPYTDPVSIPPVRARVGPWVIRCPFLMRDAAWDVECGAYAERGLAAASRLVWSPKCEFGDIPSHGRLEELLESRDDELWLPSLLDVRRVDNFVLSVALSIVAEPLALVLLTFSSFRSAVTSARSKEVSPILLNRSRVLAPSRWSR
jgi:hypothetical protein